VRCAPKGDPLLRQVRVFIAEDEPFISLSLASEVQEAHGHVIGPAGSVAEALSLLEHTQPHVGLLDANLSDGEITPSLNFFGHAPFQSYSIAGSCRPICVIPASLFTSNLCLLTNS
jgi:hypothetical protein